MSQIHQKPVLKHQHSKKRLSQIRPLGSLSRIPSLASLLPPGVAANQIPPRSDGGIPSTSVPYSSSSVISPSFPKPKTISATPPAQIDPLTSLD